MSFPRYMMKSGCTDTNRVLSICCDKNFLEVGIMSINTRANFKLDMNFCKKYKIL